MQFSAKTMERFRNKRFQGLTFEPEALAMIGSFGSGRFVIIGLRCREGAIAEARFRTFNCISVIAAADWACEWVQQRAYHEVVEGITPERVLKALDGLPTSRKFCAHMVCDALITAARQAHEKGILQ